MSQAVEPVAIVGLSLRVPQAPTVEQFWRNLVDGARSYAPIGRNELLARGVSPTLLEDPVYVPVSPILEEYEYFDETLFGVSPRDAELTDPQQRLFLEQTHAALLDAGCDPARYDGDIAVYAGSNADLYQWLNIRRNPTALAAAGELRISLGNKPDYLASSVSFRLNLRGPSMTVHTACSSSLVAIHLAAEALRNAECDMAVAGGVCVELPHGVGYLADEGYTSADGQCRPFDAAANGTVYGSGVGVVVLKRLTDARADGDRIRALIIGNAVNNDGLTKASFTAPSVTGQLEVVTQALASAGAAPRSVSYVEAHGTGTVLGDGIEVAALTSAYGRRATERGWCGIGSVKSNIGHLSAAGGVVGVIKTVLAMEHRLIPPTINFERPHPDIDFAASPFYVVATLTKWEPDDQQPLRAGVSSIGLGGTNAHVVLQEAPQPAGSDHSPAVPSAVAADARPDGAQLLALSAATPSALVAACAGLSRHLSEHPGLSLADVAQTLRFGRPEYQHRAAVVAIDRTQAVAGLTDPKRRAVGDSAAPPRVALLFPGQGAQYPGMGSHLYRTQAVFAEALTRCAQLAQGELTEDLLDLIFATGAAAEERLSQPAVQQVALFSVEYALARQWRHWGLAPAAMIGHSIGELVAATVAGVFDLADAVRLAAARGRLIAGAPDGRMLAVQATAAEVAGWLPDALDLAVINGPGTCVVAGPPGPVVEFADRLKDRGVGSTLLRVPYALHSRLMRQSSEEFGAAVAAVPRHAPELAIWSGAAAAPLSAQTVVDPQFWARQLCEPVRFGAAVAGLTATAAPMDWVLVECGPGRQLAGLARLSAPAGSRPPLRTLPAPGEKLTDEQTAFDAVGRLWTLGVQVRLSSGAGLPRRVALPGYPYERSRHWIDPATIGSTVDSQHGGRGVAGPAVEKLRHESGVIEVPVWRQLPPAVAGPAPERCLVFAMEPLGLEIAGRLRATGAAVTLVSPGERFAASSDGYQVRLNEVADYQRLLTQLGQRPQQIVHAWALGRQATNSGLDAYWTAQQHGFLSLIALIEALPEAQVDLAIVTAGVCDVLGDDAVCPGHATVAGVVRAAALERPGLSARWIDADHSEFNIDSLVAELTGSKAPTVVALRRGRRWSQEFAPIELPEHAPVLGAARTTGGRYLIIGGTGRVGGAVAAQLAGPGAAIALVSRGASAAPETIEHLAGAGAQVRQFAADVCDVAALRGVREQFLAEFGGLDGIVHAARLPDTGLNAAQRIAQAQAELGPKVAGTLALRKVFGDLPLDFVLLSSSVTALAGGAGRTDDSAANAFLDAFARSAHGWPARVIVVNWGAWQDEAVPGHDGLPSAAAVAALSRVLAGDLRGQVAIGAYSVAAVLEHERRFAEGLAGPTGPASLVGLAGPAGAEALSAKELVAAVSQIWCDVLGAAYVGPHDNFFKLGGTSLVAAQLILRIRQAVGARLSMRVLFDAPTVSSMVARIEALRNAPSVAAAPERPIPRLARPGRPA